MTIVPRWEWRSFGENFGPAESRLASLPPDRVDESDDTYLLAPESDASVKVRGGLMDVKHRLGVDEEGLEQWTPVMKSPFPLSASDAGFVLETLGTTSASLDRGAGTIEELADAGRDLTVVAVHKRRLHYTLDGCMVELSELRTDHGATRTIAVESEDAEPVVAAVRALGFDPRRNVCVARGLKSLAGVGIRRFAVIDVGTSSVKFHVGEQRADGEWRTLADRAEVTRLGEGLDGTGRLRTEPIARTVDAIAAMAAEARREGAEAIAAVGTAGLRIAPNSAELVDAVLDRCGVRVEIIPGDEEARLAYQAVKAGLGLARGSLVVFDTGGGSSQFTFGEDERVDERFSLNVGAARFTERFGLGGVVSEDTLATVPDAIVGMGGAVTNLAAVKHELAAYDPDTVQGTVLE